MSKPARHRSSLLKRLLWAGVGSVLFALCSVVVLASYYGIDYTLAGKQGVRIIAVPVLAAVHSGDDDFVKKTCNSYLVGKKLLQTKSLLAEWRDAEKTIPGFHVLSGSGLNEVDDSVPFVYQRPDAPPLKTLAEQYNLPSIVASGKDEFDKFKLLCAWIGTRWDHGVDPVPGGNLTYWPADVIAAGEGGASFWCEIAARLTVQSATSLGWPARLVTASRNGYDWQHALAEIWSNQFNKWVLFDTDYNIYYQADGIPLSAFELCHRGPSLQDRGQLQVVRFAPLKPSLQDVDLLDLYKYVHVDMRNDWYSRRLSPGSPASGDLATWWTSRPELGPVLTAKIKADDPLRFDWAVNPIMIQIDGVADDKKQVNIALRAYSPYFQSFEWTVDDQPWSNDQDGLFSLPLQDGQHCLETRVRSLNNNIGPVYNVCYDLDRIRN